MSAVSLLVPHVPVPARHQLCISFVTSGPRCTWSPGEATSLVLVKQAWICWFSRNQWRFKVLGNALCLSAGFVSKWLNAQHAALSLGACKGADGGPVKTGCIFRPWLLEISQSVIVLVNQIVLPLRKQKPRSKHFHFSKRSVTSSV